MKKKLLATLLVSGALLSLAGCGEKKDKAAEASEDGKSTINWMAVLSSPTPPTDVVLDKIEEATNTNIEFQWMPAANYEERLTTSLASGELADIVSLQKMGNSTVKSSLKNGVFWDITPYLKDYKNLSEIPEGLLDSIRVDGKIYGVPMQKNLSRCGFSIRKDWLDNLGLEIPTTTDELFEIARAFTEDDPDGNGKDDTIGIYDRGFTDINYTSFKNFTMYFGGVTGWGVDAKGNFHKQEEDPAWKEAMNFYKKLYDAGYVNQDFAIAQKKDQNEQFSRGYYGMMAASSIQNMSSFERDAAKLGDESMDLTAVNKISSDGSNDYRVWTEGNGLNGMLAFPKSEVKDEKRLKEILSFVDSLLDEEEWMLMSYGIEGVHYKINDDGSLEQTDMDAFGADVQQFGSSRPSAIKYPIKSADPKIEEGAELIRENETFGILDPSMGLDSPTYNEVGSEINKILIDATVKYIMGQIDEDGFDDALQEWRDRGGDKIKAEYEASYKENRM